MSEDWDDDRELTEEEKDAAAKALSWRNAPNDFHSPEGAYTAHDRLRGLTTTYGLEFPEGSQLRDLSSELRDIVEDHERLLRVAMWIRELLQHEALKLDGAGGMLNAKKVREDMLNALGRLNSEMSRLYLDAI